MMCFSYNVDTTEQDRTGLDSAPHNSIQLFHSRSVDDNPAKGLDKLLDVCLRSRVSSETAHRSAYALHDSTTHH